MADELNQNYPAYSKSIFSDFDPNNQEVLDWQENVLDKVQGDSILPHYIEKDKDFNIFWGWITHFFAVIVYFVRNFKKFFINYNDYLNEIGEFFKEKDFIQDSRIQINKNLEIPLVEKIYHKIFCGHRLLNGVYTNNSNYNCTDYLPLGGGNLILLKVLGYNSDLEEYSGSAVNNIDICFYDLEKGYIGRLNTFNITASEAFNGKKVLLPVSNFNYIRISYPRLGSISLPLYLGVFLEKKGNSFQENKTEEEIFNNYSSFRKRGTFKGASFIKTILESKTEDNFYADYLPIKNVGWFLNKTSPIFQELNQKIKINSFSLKDLTQEGVNSLIHLEEQYFLLNQNFSLVLDWVGNVYSNSPYDSLSDSESYILLDSESYYLLTPEMVNPSSPYDIGDSRIIINVSLYDENKSRLSDVPLLGNWAFNQSNQIITSTYSSGTNYSIELIPKYISNGKFRVELPIEIIDAPKNAIFNSGCYDKDWFDLNQNKIYLFSLKNNSGTHKAKYLKINYINFVNASVSENGNYFENFDLGLYLRKLPITMGFINNKQYYLCCFKNNGKFSDSKAKELISQKVLPYNGQRIFVDNNFYKNYINIPLEIEEFSFIRETRTIRTVVRGGVPPYKFKFDYGATVTSYNRIYDKVYSTGSWRGEHIISVIDALGEEVKTSIYNSDHDDIVFKLKLFIDKYSYLKTLILVSGGTETSYSLQKLDSSDNILEEKTIPANIWINITDMIPSLSNSVFLNKKFKIVDNKVNTISKVLDNFYFLNFALDIYDNGEGELIN